MNIQSSSIRATGIALWLFGASALTSASAVTCGDGVRTLSVDPAITCQMPVGDGTANDAEVDAVFGADFSKVGEVAPGSGSGTNSGGFLTTSITSGSWGSANMGGNFFIADSFWNTYDRAVLSLHVGGGQSSLDDFLLEIVKDAVSGTFLYANTGSGGGTSNFKLWGAGTGSGIEVPDPSMLSILMLGMIGLVWARKRDGNV